MQTTFTKGLSPAFYGKAVRSGVPAYDNNGNIRTVGGYIAADNTNPALFGAAVYSDPATPDAFYIGATASATVFRGILLNQYYVNEQLPAHADRLLNTQPASAVYEGALWVTVSNFDDAQVGWKLTAAADGTFTAASAGTIGTIVELDADTERVCVHLN